MQGSVVQRGIHAWHGPVVRWLMHASLGTAQRRLLQKQRPWPRYSRYAVLWLWMCDCFCARIKRYIKRSVRAATVVPLWPLGNAIKLPRMRTAKQISSSTQCRQSISRNPRSRSKALLDLDLRSIDSIVEIDSSHSLVSYVDGVTSQTDAPRLLLLLLLLFVVVVVVVALSAFQTRLGEGLDHRPTFPLLHFSCSRVRSESVFPRLHCTARAECLSFPFCDAHSSHPSHGLPWCRWFLLARPPPLASTSNRR